VVDPAEGLRWLVDATPDLPRQARALDALLPATPERRGADGILLTHAHTGHYTGLLHLGREGMAADGVPVFALPRLEAFLRASGPWELLGRLGHVDLRALRADEPLALGERVTATPRLVPHRGEYSETVAFELRGPSRAVLFLPDIDSWDAWETPVEAAIAAVDRAYLDGTFFSGDELPGRDMSEVPHPTIEASLERLGDLPASERAKVRFVHLNHTNPALDPSSEARRRIEAAGFAVAAEGERFAL
jgi:pyrroloquinoline quinone biosynthesis protein B